jgi:hypothetical protein
VNSGKGAKKELKDEDPVVWLLEAEVEEGVVMPLLEVSVEAGQQLLAMAGETFRFMIPVVRAAIVEGGAMAMPPVFSREVAAGSVGLGVSGALGFLTMMADCRDARNGQGARKRREAMWCM